MKSASTVIFLILLVVMVSWAGALADTTAGKPAGNRVSGKAGDGSDHDRAWAASNRAVCGANCLYTLMRINDLDVELAQIKSAISSTESGSSLLELKQVAEQLGASATLFKKPTFELHDHQLPAIAFGRLGATVRADDPRDQMGHFVVILELDRKNRTVTYMDGTSGKIESEIPEKWFNDKMNIGMGFSLQTQSSPVWETVLAIGLMVVFGVGLIVLGK